MSTGIVLRTVRAVQRGELTEEQRDALAQLLLSVHVAVELDDDPTDEWRPVAAALRELLTPPPRHAGNVVPMRPSCLERRSR